MEDIKMPSTGKIVKWVILFFIGLTLLSVLGTFTGFITIPWLKFGKQVQMERGIIAKTYNADNALYNYHWFKERITALKAIENKIQNAKDTEAGFISSAGARKDWSFEDKTESARLSTVTLGLKNQYEDLSAEYNARALEVDRAIFSQDLPLFFSIKPF